MRLKTLHSSSTKKAFSPRKGRLAVPSKSPAVPFQALLQASQSTKESLVEPLLRRIDEAAKALVLEPSMQHYHGYMACIRAFFEEAIPKVYHLKEGTSLNAKTLEKKKMYCLQEVDTHLAQILASLREEQVRRVNLERDIHMIKGLLLDVLQ